MANLETLKIEVIEPTQRLWSTPYGTDDETRRVRLAALAEHLKTYSGESLGRAREHLVRTHKGSWPQVPDWLKALKETTSTVPKSEPCAMPWIARDVHAQREFRANFCNTALARMAKDEGWWTEYESSMTRLIWEALRDNRDVANIALEDELIAFFRKKGRDFVDAAAYRDTKKYQVLHGEKSGWQHNNKKRPA